MKETPKIIRYVSSIIIVMFSFSIKNGNPNNTLTGGSLEKETGVFKKIVLNNFSFLKIPLLIFPHCFSVSPLFFWQEGSLIKELEINVFRWLEKKTTRSFSLKYYFHCLYLHINLWEKYRMNQRGVFSLHLLFQFDSPLFNFMFLKLKGLSILALI